MENALFCVYCHMSQTCLIRAGIYSQPDASGRQQTPADATGVLLFCLNTIFWRMNSTHAQMSSVACHSSVDKSLNIGGEQGMNELNELV